MLDYIGPPRDFYKAKSISQNLNIRKEPTSTIPAVSNLNMSNDHVNQPKTETCWAHGSGVQFIQKRSPATLWHSVIYWTTPLDHGSKIEGCLIFSLQSPHQILYITPGAPNTRILAATCLPHLLITLLHLKWEWGWACTLLKVLIQRFSP